MFSSRRTVVVVAAVVAVGLAVLAGVALVKGGTAGAAPLPGQWVAGDMHSHTWLSDGEETEAAVLKHGLSQFGLDWIGTADHGAPSTFDPLGKRMRGMNVNEDPVPVSMDSGSACRSWRGR